jgi:hypothetical protein
MRVESPIESYDLTNRLAVKRQTWNGFTLIDTSQTIRPTAAFNGRLYIVEGNVTITIEHDGFGSGDVVRFMFNGAETANITSVNAAIPATSLDISAGQYVDCIWAEDKWIFIGSFTI